ncbi:maintenance of mitochondrial structure and function-domain-containing protein [Sphaerosporella brunnea]|uniref:Maintenance of mitochondrial structure and function-domain-containing protein n=1 Tax=Sphaerosporella brunnea TaxID=1250544 RepID=A0A5J5F668_9PEZI|nr:maintenance of mitochondrial structure and function-domain-containing protein [Sphaerosporella brunnea]
MDRFNRLFAQQMAGDNSETVYISSLALLKMLRHGRVSVPMEVFAIPQSGTGVSVEAVDPVFQTKMMDMLKQTGRPVTVVGWYYSHPGFGCWLNPRAVAVVVDPIQSVKGKVVIDAFRLINPQAYVLGQEARQITSNLGHLNKPSIQALIHSLNRHYYSIAINYRKTHLEENMLMNLHKTVWTDSLTMKDFKMSGQENQERLQKMVTLAEQYEKRVKGETLKSRYIGKVDPKKHLEELGKIGIEENMVSSLVEMVDKVASIASEAADAMDAD